MANVRLREKFIVMNAYITKSDRSEINNVMMHFKLLQKQEKARNN
jgi:hypothetical protein